jgi:hypothetical protein
MGVGLQDLQCVRSAGWPLDVDRPRLPGRDSEAVVVGEDGPDDFLLDLAVERDVDFLPLDILPQVDED